MPFQVVRGVPRIPDKRSIGKSGTQRHGDAGIAKLLLYYAYRMDEGFEINYRSIGERVSTFGSRFSTSRTRRGFGTIRGRNDFTGY